MTKYETTTEEVEVLVLEARIEEQHKALADFEPVYLTLTNPRKRPHLTEKGEARLEELINRYAYHKGRIDDLTTQLQALKQKARAQWKRDKKSWIAKIRTCRMTIGS